MNMEGTTKQATKCDWLCMLIFFSSSRSHLTKFVETKRRDRQEKKKPKIERTSASNCVWSMKNDGKWRQWTKKRQLNCDENKNLVTTQTKTERHIEFYRLDRTILKLVYTVWYQSQWNMFFLSRLWCVYHKTTLP